MSSITQTLLTGAGKLLHSLNPSLLAMPPPTSEQSGSDVCYLGEGGTGALVYCKDLEHGMRGIVGSWCVNDSCFSLIVIFISYFILRLTPVQLTPCIHIIYRYLTPERHVIEGCLMSIICIAVLAFLFPSLPQCPAGADPRPPFILRVLTAVCFTLQLTYKVFGFSQRILFMLMPCNAIWCLHALHAFGGLGNNASHILCQLIVTYVGLPIVAIVVPDFSDMVLPFEREFFYVHHALLIIYPVYYVGSGKASISGDGTESVAANFARWYGLASAAFGLFYFAVVTPLAIHSGFNLNFMLSPPPNPGDMVGGPNFRLQSVGCCCTLFFLMRLVALLLEPLAERRTRQPKAQKEA